MASTDNIKIYNDTVLRHTILQGQESERTIPGEFAMGELAFTRDTGRVFVGTYTEKSQSNDYNFHEGGLIVGNKFHGIAEKDKNGKFGKIEYVARHIRESDFNKGENITDTNFYEGDMVFDASNKSLVIFNFNGDERNDINIKSFNVPTHSEEPSEISSEEPSVKYYDILKTRPNDNCYDIIINEEELQSFISDKLDEGFEKITIKSHCSLPKDITYNNTNISLSLDNVKENTEYITTITKNENDVVEFSSTSYEDFFKMANVTVRPDEESPGIKVRKSSSDDEGGKGTVYKIGLDPERGLLNDLQTAQTKISKIETDLDALPSTIKKCLDALPYFQNKGLHYFNLADLTEVSYNGNLVTITKDNFPSEVTEEIYSLIDSVILQVTIITTDLPENVEGIVLNYVKDGETRHVLQSYPRKSGTFTTTLEIPYEITEASKKFKLYCNQPNYVTVKVLGYRI